MSVAEHLIQVGRVRLPSPAVARSVKSLRFTGRIYAALMFLLTASIPGLALAEADVEGFVGSSVCRDCHEEAYATWVGSHHDLAIAEATEDVVLGDFSGVSFDHFGVESTFYRDDGRFMVRTDGPVGDLQDYPIRYTFGWHPLQQYLIDAPGGRLQALGIAWDSRSAAEGGQRWFHLYPDEPVDHRDELHWTRPSQNWNHMCAECHGTNVEKRYDVEAGLFETTWSEIDVSCESCHGPGAEHLEWAASGASDPEMGLLIEFTSRADRAWISDPDTGLPRRARTGLDRTEVNVCAPCHSRRGTVSEVGQSGAGVDDTHRVSLLEPELYDVDGQPIGEVYVYGSFLQSRMYARGVTCSDCHEPHSLELRAPGNGVCAQCHDPARYDTEAHHFHEVETAGALCAECHMPASTFMVVDPRHEHAFRVPRPDLSRELGTRNACTDCHLGKDAVWADDRMSDWYGEGYKRRPEFARALHAGRSGLLDAERGLMGLAEDFRFPGIARASAVALLPSYLSPDSLALLARRLDDADPLVRRASVQSLDALPVARRAELLVPLLDDPVRTVRMEAARSLAEIPVERLPSASRDAYNTALREFVDAQTLNADRPEAHLALGNLAARQGRVADARRSFNEAVALDPEFVPAYANLGDMYRSMGDDEAAERALERGLEHSPDTPELLHGLGLLRVRQGRMPEALDLLSRASLARPGSVRFGYVYAIGLSGVGRTDEALAELRRLHESAPANRDVLVALVTVNRDAGHREEARLYASRLAALAPWDPGVQQLARDLAAP